jgi:hypothetical protein
LYGNFFFLLAGALLFDEKIRQGSALFWLGLPLLVFFKYSTHKLSSNEQLLTLPNFWSPV